MFENALFRELIFGYNSEYLTLTSFMKSVVYTNKNKDNISQVEEIESTKINNF